MKNPSTRSSPQNYVYNFGTAKFNIAWSEYRNLKKVLTDALKHSASLGLLNTWTEIIVQARAN